MTNEEVYKKAIDISKTKSVSVGETMQTGLDGKAFKVHTIVIDNVMSVCRSSYVNCFSELAEKFSDPIQVEKEQLRGRLSALEAKG